MFCYSRFNVIMLCHVLMLSVVGSFAGTINININKINTEDQYEKTVVTDLVRQLQLSPDDVNPPTDAFISLGYCCSAALHLKLFKISTAYYPFDFIRTPFESLCTLLETRFKHFFTKDALVWERERVVDTITKCSSMHDFKHKKFADYEVIAAKYQRRIERFYKTIEQAKHIYFFRSHIVKEEALLLQALLKKLFPDKSFTLVVLKKPINRRYTRLVQEPWGLPGIKEFQLYGTEAHTNNHGREEDWRRVFQSLGIILP